MDEVDSSSSPSLTSSDVADDDPPSFYFESEALALQGNADYRALLSTMSLLEAQRSRALRDLQRLVEMQRVALADPIAFVDGLQRRRPLDGGDIRPQRVAELPTIAWEKYAINIDPAMMAKQRRTRNKKMAAMESDSSAAATGSATPSMSTELDDGVDASVRGRVKLESSASHVATFNQLWSSEEQRRLQQLLLDFPPEDVEARRWSKIARALGNRTSQQVASRVQKYFIKLARAGLPVPGRIPNVGQYNKKGAHRHQRYNKFYFQPSTFLTSYEPPVYMSDEDDDSMSHVSFGNDVMDGQQVEPLDGIVSDEDDISEELRDSPMYRELLMLKRLRNEKLTARGGLVEHTGFKCDGCNCDPIVGTRWHCRDCPTDECVDFCDECAECPCEIEHHDSSHRLDAIRQPASAASSGADHDYMHFMPDGYNYLDSNYLPAT